MTRVIGLTGGIACGKSTVSEGLVAHGLVVLDCDLIARQVVEPGRRAFKQIVAAFGEDVLLEDGTLDRRKLGDIVFKNKDKLKKLTAITGPAIFLEISKQIFFNWCRGTPIVVVDAPTLFETKMLVGFCAQVIVVAASEETQVRRIVARDKLSEEQAMDRIRSQMPVHEKVQRAHVTIFNDGSLEDLAARTAAVTSDLEARYRYGFSLLWCMPTFVALGALVYVRARLFR